jgi:hypothetical protein
MAAPRNNRRAPVADPAAVANQRILAERQDRIDAKNSEKALATDLGLNLKDPDPDPDRPTEDPVEFLSEEWDRKTFGDAIPTYTRVVYGPDPLLINCPEVKASIENIGLERYANATAEAIRLKEENAVPDPIMRTGLRAAIARFGVAAVAMAFHTRIMRIPQRTVEVEADRSDAMIFAQPMEEAVLKYGSPGMAPKFLSDRCVGVLGMRGYKAVIDERGDPVKVGTLIMAEIPLRMAEARRRHYAEESEEKVRDSQAQFEDVAVRAIREEGNHPGLGVLGQGEMVTATDTADRASFGRSREVGFNVER